MRRPRTLRERRWAGLGRTLALAALLTAGAGEGAAVELWRRGDASLEVTGSLREIVTVTRGTDADRFAEGVAAAPGALCVRAAGFADCPAFDALGGRDVWQSLTRLRTRFDLRAGAHVSATIVYDHELRAGILDTFEGELGRSLATDRLLDLEGDVDLFGIREEGRRVRWRHLLYRGFLRVETSRVDLVVGRQRIPWGVGRLWNPMDRFNAVPPLAIEGDQSPGVDAVDLKLRASGFSYLELAWAPADGSDDLLAARWHGVAGAADYSLMAGVFEEAWTFGVDAAANVGGAAARLELLYTDPSRRFQPLSEDAPTEVDAFFQVLVSVDYNLDWGSGLYLLAEHFYNGNATGFGRGKAGVLEPFFEGTAERPPGVPAFVPGPFATAGSPDRFAGNRFVTAAKHQTGLQAGYDLTPILRGNLVVLYDWNGTSAAFFPSLAWTPTGALELTAGVQLFAGSDRSQYGGAERLLFLLAEYFF